jgi:phosphate acetyltransferase
MAVVGAGGKLALESARRATETGLIEPCLVGDREAIAAIAESIAWDLSGIRVEQAGDEAKAAETAVALARGGEVAALMKGQIHTDALMRAVVARDIGLRGGRRISHVFHMTIPGREGELLISDAAINVSPDPATRIDIIANAVQVLHALGNDEPKVAVLSATETPIEAMPSSQEAAEISRRAAQGEVSGAVVDGPFALDVAISPAASAVKGVDSPVAGRADILLVPNIETGNSLYKAMVHLPNIETGNSLYKAMVHFMSATAAGLVMGARVPIVLTSRADPPEARLTAVALAAIVAAHQD